MAKREDEERRVYKNTPEGAAVLAALDRIEALREVVEFTANQLRFQLAGDAGAPLLQRIQEMRQEFRRTQEAYPFEPDPDRTPPE